MQQQHACMHARMQQAVALFPCSSTSHHRPHQPDRHRSLVVTPLLERITGEEVPATPSSSAAADGDDDGAAARQALRGEYGEEERRAQKEINLGDDVEEAVR
jgi:hypothetical protein